MKRILISLKLVFVSIILTNCYQKENTSNLNTEEIEISSVKNNFLTWKSTNSDRIKAYQVKLNDLIIEDNVSQTIIDEINSVIEFNKPVTQFKIPDTLLNKKITNNISVRAIYLDGTEIESKPISI